MNNCHSARSCSGLTGHPEDWRQRRRDYPIKSGNDQKRRTSGNDRKRDYPIKSGNDREKRMSGITAVRETSRITEI